MPRKPSASDAPPSTPQSTKRKPPHIQKAPVAEMTEAARKLGITPAQLVAEIGYGPNAASQWAAKGEMPKVAALACLYRLTDKAAPTERLMIIRPPDEEGSRLIARVAEAVGGKIAYL
jgi:hypothetical protein